MRIDYFRLRNISEGLHHENPFTSVANRSPTAFKSAMFFASALIGERNLQIYFKNRAQCMRQLKLECDSESDVCVMGNQTCFKTLHAIMLSAHTTYLTCFYHSLMSVHIVIRLSQSC